MTAKPEDNLGARLTPKQARALDALLDSLRGKGEKFDIIETPGRIKVAWEFYLRSIQIEAEAASDPTKKIPKGSTATTRRTLLQTLKIDLGRAAQIEDLISSFPTVKFNPELLELFREDIANLQQSARRRTRAELRDERFRKLVEGPNQARSGSKKASKKGSRK